MWSSQIKRKDSSPTDSNRCHLEKSPYDLGKAKIVRDVFRSPCSNRVQIEAISLICIMMHTPLSNNFLL